MIVPQSVSKNAIINQLVKQQFYLPPNLITDRTYRKQIEVEGAEEVITQFTNLLRQLSYDVSGTNLQTYENFLEQIEEALNFPKRTIIEKFKKKANGFLQENLETEDILFITVIASILEVIDSQNYEIYISNLFNYYKSLFASSNQSKINTIFEGGVKRLAEIADSKFSLLHNITKVQDLASKLGIHISYNEVEVNEIRTNVIQEIHSTKL